VYAQYYIRDNCIVFEKFTASIVDLMGEFHQNRNNSTAFEELSVSIVDLTVYFISGRTLKSALAFSVPLQFPRINDVRFLIPICLLVCLCFIYVI
jgi:hypothetical protein